MEIIESSISIWGSTSPPLPSCVKSSSLSFISNCSKSCLFTPTRKVFFIKIYIMDSILLNTHKSLIKHHQPFYPSMYLWRHTFYFRISIFMRLWYSVNIITYSHRLKWVNSSFLSVHNSYGVEGSDFFMTLYQECRQRLTIHLPKKLTIRFACAIIDLNISIMCDSFVPLHIFVMTY